MGKYIFLNPTFWVDIWRYAQIIYLRESLPVFVEGTVLREKNVVAGEIDRPPLEKVEFLS